MDDINDGTRSQVSTSGSFCGDDGCGQDAFLQAVLNDIDASGPECSLSNTYRQSGSNTNSYCGTGTMSIETYYSSIISDGANLAKELDETVAGTSKIRDFECPFCHREFNNASFKAHLQSHTGKPFQCTICGRAFAQKGNVKKHIEMHKVYPHRAIRPAGGPDGEIPMDKILFQQLDQSMRSNVRRMEKCKEERETGSAAYRCPYCGDLFHCYVCIRKHLPSHRDKKIFECPLRSCNQLFASLEEFLAHLPSHSDGMRYNCPICGKTFESLSDIGVHQCAHVIARENRPFVKRSHRCEDCGDVFKSDLSLERHRALTSHHYQCTQCQRVYTSPRLLRKHLKSHRSTRDHVCDVCKKGYVNGWLLKWHVKSTHCAPGPRFNCTQCSKKFTRRDILRRHQSTVHGGDTLFECTFEGCGRMFKRQDRLKEHLLIHDGVKKYHCNDCGKSFTRLQGYKIHVRSVHEKVYRFRCDGCEKGFNRPDKYEKHKNGCKLIDKKVPARN